MQANLSAARDMVGLAKAAKTQTDQGARQNMTVMLFTASPLSSSPFRSSLEYSV
jgi:hypothetical protein